MRSIQPRMTEFRRKSLLVYIKDIETVIRNLPDDRQEALIEFHNRIAENTIAKYNSVGLDQKADLTRSYLLYMREFVRYRDYNLTITSDIEQSSSQGLDEIKASIDVLLDVYRNNVTLRKITSSMTTTLSEKPQYFDGVILDQSTT